MQWKNISVKGRRIVRILRDSLRNEGIEVEDWPRTAKLELGDGRGDMYAMEAKDFRIYAIQYPFIPGLGWFAPGIPGTMEYDDWMDQVSKETGWEKQEA